MNETSKNRRVDTIFVMIIFCIFAISVLIVLVLAAGSYQKMTDISRDRQDERTILSYISTKVKSSDDAGMIHIGEFNGIPALFFDEIIGDTLFRTAIYSYDGWVRELFSNPEAGLTPQDGMRLAELDDLIFEYLSIEANRLIVVKTEDQDLLLYPRSQITPNLHNRGPVQ